jgi:hypothetical protein
MIKTMTYKLEDFSLHVFEKTERLQYNLNRLNKYIKEGEQFEHLKYNSDIYDSILKYLKNNKELDTKTLKAIENMCVLDPIGSVNLYKFVETIKPKNIEFLKQWEVRQ